MPKLKTKSAIKKRFRIRSGEIIAKCIGKRHNLRKRSTKLKKQKTGLQPINFSDIGLITRCIPYGIKGVRLKKSKFCFEYCYSDIELENEMIEQEQNVAIKEEEICQE